MQKKFIVYNNRKIEYNFERKSIKNINLRIKQDATVYISAPYDVKNEYIDKFVMERAPWILKHIEKFEKIKKSNEKNNQVKQYISGETFKYLGKDYRLKVIKNDKNNIVIEKDNIKLYTNDVYNVLKKEKLMQNWYRVKAIIIFNECLDDMMIIMDKYNLTKPEMKIRNMKSRWGSCYINRNKIIINLNLIKSYRICIEYIILHELVHFLCKYHNKEFYSYMTLLMPDWKERKILLREIT